MALQKDWQDKQTRVTYTNAYLRIGFIQSYFSRLPGQDSVSVVEVNVFPDRAARDDPDARAIKTYREGLTTVVRDQAEAYVALKQMPNYSDSIDV